MTEPLRNWTVSINNAYSPGGSHTIQYQQSLYQLKVTFTLAGWTVTRSSNTVTAGASDNWSGYTSVVPGAAGSGSWVVLQSPSTWAAETIQFLLYTSDSVAPYTTIGAKWATGTYSGGSTTTLPTASGTETTETSSTSRAMIQWTTYLQARWARWYTTRGDVIFGVKAQGNPGFNWFFMFMSNGGPNDNYATGGHGVGAYRMYMVMTANGVGANAIDSNLWSSTTTRSLTPTGAIPTHPGFVAGPWDATTLFDDGLDMFGRVPLSMSELWQDIGTSGRSLGTVVDLHAGPPTGIVGTVISGEETQVLRRVCVGEWYMYMPTASLPWL